MQTVSVFHEGADIRYCYIISTNETSGINPNYQIMVCETDGTTATYTLATNVALNNNNLTSASNIDWNALLNTFTKFELNSNQLVDRLNYYTATSSDDTYSVFTAPSTQNKTVKCICVIPNDEIRNNYAVCALFNDGVLTDIAIKRLINSTLCFISQAECTDIKLMVWENLNTLKPILGSTDVNINGSSV